MSRKSLLSFLVKSSLGLALVYGLGGCAQKPIPPAFSLYGYQRIAVVPFENQTQDPALAAAAQEEMTGQVVDLNAVPLIQASQVRSYLQSAGIKASSLSTDSAARQKLGEKFKCDLLLLGTVSGYNEFLKDKAPERIGSEGQGQWGFYTNRKVVINASAQLMDVASGSLLWTRKSQGYSYYNTWNPLPIPGDVMIPEALHQFANLALLVKNRVTHQGDEEPVSLDESNPDILLYPKNRYFSELRQKALYQTFNYMVADFRGRGNWTPDLKGN